MIIGITGFKQSGKSTAAKYLEDKYGFTRHNFKDALVQELKDNFPDLLAELEIHYNLSTPHLFIQKPPLMRALMINYGTEVRRKDDSNYWVGEWISRTITANYNLVADDVRFLNEAIAVRESGGIIIRLTRPDLLTGGDHVSETEQLQIVADHTIDCNPGDKEALYRALDKIIL